MPIIVWDSTTAPSRTCILQPDRPGDVRVALGTSLDISSLAPFTVKGPPKHLGGSLRNYKRRLALEISWVPAQGRPGLGQLPSILLLGEGARPCCPTTLVLMPSTPPASHRGDAEEALSFPTFSPVDSRHASCCTDRARTLPLETTQKDTYDT